MIFGKLSPEEKQTIKDAVFEYLDKNPSKVTDAVATHLTNGLMSRELQGIRYEIQNKVTAYMASKVSRIFIKNGSVDRIIDTEDLKSRVTETLARKLLE